ncbi:MAG: hypothetical protein D6769_01425 [Methanobacteriota archaeon]|nr:MAG: hypothetical protein D6769_01425 [Euryarchaeota archaeon]
MEGNFLHLHDKFTEDALYSLILCPFEETTAYMRGTSLAPDAVVKESHNVEPYDYSLGVNAASKGIETKRAKSMEELPSLYDGRFTVFLGGEHTLSLYSSEPFKELFVFDAHADMLNTYGSREIAHATWARRAVEAGKSLTLYGIRSVSEDEKDFIDGNGGISILSSGQLSSIKSKELYLSVDVDVLDMAAMPCCSNPEPAGLMWNELYSSLELLFKNNNVLACDVVEHRPCKGREEFSYAVASLTYKLFCLKERYG